MKACVIFDTRYGNTEKIARALEAGLKQTGIQTECINVKDVVIHSLSQYDLICIGGPTHLRTASQSMQDFLESLAGLNLVGKALFAFDTRRDSLLAGSAARYIEERLRKRGMMIVTRRLSAMIVGPESERSKSDFGSRDEWKEWRHGAERLQEGEEGRFEQIGNRIGTSLAQVNAHG